MRRGMTLVAAMFLLLPACDAGKDPKQALVDGFEGLADARGLRMVFSLSSDVQSLQTFMKGLGRELTSEGASKLLDSSVTVAQKEARDARAQQAQIEVNIAGNENAVELRQVRDALFARADVREIATTLGRDPAALNQLVGRAQGPAAALLRTAINGNWLRLDGVSQLNQQVTGQAPPARQREALRRFADTLERDARVTEGVREGPGDHLIATISARSAYDSLLRFSREAGQALPQTGLTPPDRVPDENIELHAWVEDDFVRQIELDLIQLQRLFDNERAEGTGRTFLRLRLEEFTDDVEPPQGATRVDTQSIAQLVAPFLLQNRTTAPPRTPTGDVCEQFENAPREVKAQLVDQCPQFRTG